MRRARAAIVPICMLGLATSVRAAAQSPTGDALVDSAAVAREAWRAATRAPTAAEALPLLLRATTAWPAQSAYWSALLRVSAMAGADPPLRRAVNQLIAFGLEPVIVRDSVAWRRLAAILPRAEQEAVVQRARPLARGVTTATIADSTFFAEGLDIDGATGALYVASIRRRTVVEVHRGRVRDLQLFRDARMGAVFAVRVAADGATLWCTTAPHENADTVSAQAVPALVQVRVADGAILRVVPLPPDAQRRARTPGDLVLLPDGSVLVSDSDAPALLHYHPDTEAWESITDGRWRSPQGIALLPGGRVAMLADWSHGLFRVDLRTHMVTPVHTATDVTVLGLDGLSWYDGGLIAVQNGVEPARIVHVRLSDRADSVIALRLLDRQPRLAPAPTAGAVRGDTYVYVANSQWDAYEQGRRTQRPLEPTRLVCVSLARSTRRQGSRNTASTPPASASCTVSDAASP